MQSDRSLKRSENSAAMSSKILLHHSAFYHRAEPLHSKGVSSTWEETAWIGKLRSCCSSSAALTTEIGVQGLGFPRQTASCLSIETRGVHRSGTARRQGRIKLTTMLPKLLNPKPLLHPTAGNLNGMPSRSGFGPAVHWPVACRKLNRYHTH